MRYKNLICILGLVGSIVLPSKIFAQEIADASIPEFQVKGNGPEVLVLVPCMSCRWTEWEEFMDRESAQGRFTMYAVTLPGFGGTPVPDLPVDSNLTPWRDYAVQALSNFIDEKRLEKVTLVGHSFGTMVALQMAVRRNDKVVKALVNVDGPIESDSWTPSEKKEQLRQANVVSTSIADGFTTADGWAKFNVVGLPSGDSVPREAAMRAIKIHGSFMATPKHVLIQYWRENPLIDLTADLRKLKIPILDIQSFTGEDQEKQKSDYLNFMKKIKSPKNVKSIFFFDTRHYVMFQRPTELENTISDFVNGKKVSDFVPKPKTD